MDQNFICYDLKTWYLLTENVELVVLVVRILISITEQLCKMTKKFVKSSIFNSST